MRWLIEFIFPRRLHRIAYLLRELLVYAVVVMLCGIGGGTVYASYLLGVIIVLAIYELFFICLPRARDLEMNGWWLLLFILPGIGDALGLILLLRAPVFLHLQGEPLRAGGLPRDASAMALNQT